MGKAIDVPLSEIVDNPFQPRSSFDQATLKSLAAEIETEGFWNGCLQGRRTAKGKIELVYGHRRLRALRLNKVPSVRVEVLKLTDTQMALRSLTENLQREGLTDLEKADAVTRSVEVMRQTLIKDEKLSEAKATTQAVDLIAKRLGLSRTWVYTLGQFSTMVEKTRAVVESGAITAKTASAAEQWGGSEYVRTLARQGKEAAQKGSKIAKPTHMTVAAMKRVVREARESVQDKLKEAIWSGEVITPREAEDKARRLASAQTRRQKDPPPDLKAVIIGWTHRIKDWEKQMREVEPYMDYVEQVSDIAEEFRAALTRFIATAQKLL
jgi:ParB family transcriptional regulator, chromosome partitioning protein